MENCQVVFVQPANNKAVSKNADHQNPTIVPASSPLFILLKTDGVRRGEKFSRTPARRAS